MKVVKLNGRHRHLKEHGHTIGLRFESYRPDTIAMYEKVCRSRLRGHGWNREGDWYGGFGHPVRGSSRPYWITFRNEADLTLVMLSIKLTG